ncbi:MAG: tyrosine-type recombinase/integrase [Chloroflexota bacterium]
MAKVADSLLFRLIHDYLMVFLPTQKYSSPHTVKAYRTSLNQFLDFVKKQRDIPLSLITFEMLGSKTLSDFLDYIENERGCKVFTRNYRLACIRSFFSYAAMMEPCAIAYQLEASKVKEKPTVKNRVPEFMSEAAVKAILNQPDPNTKNGLRDQFFMVLLYDTGSRINELLNLRIKDIRIDKTATVTVFGKGSKLRTVPIMPKTASHFQNYIRAFHSDESERSDSLLFFTLRHGQKFPMSDDNVRVFMKKYAAAAQRGCSDVPDNVYPHLWRHSRAMHLYIHGMDLTLVSQWLGHANLKTTLIYASADTEHKRKAIEKAMTAENPLFDKGAFSQFKLDDDTLLKQLYGLK